MNLIKSICSFFFKKENPIPAELVGTKRGEELYFIVSAIKEAKTPEEFSMAIYRFHHREDADPELNLSLNKHRLTLLREVNDYVNRAEGRRYKSPADIANIVFPWFWEKCKEDRVFYSSLRAQFVRWVEEFTQQQKQQQ